MSPTPVVWLLLAVAVLPRIAHSQNFDICKSRVAGILNGTETFKDVTNETIGQFLYHGPVQGMNPDFERTSRASFVTLTTEGK